MGLSMIGNRTLPTDPAEIPGVALAAREGEKKS